MEFDFWQRWGGELGDVDFARAWVALGIVAGSRVKPPGSEGYIGLLERNPAAATTDINFMIARSALADALSASREHAGRVRWTFPFAATTIDADQRFPLIRIGPVPWALAWDEVASLVEVQPRLRVTAAPEKDAIAPWFRVLSEAKPSPSAVSLMLRAPDASLALEWPLRIGTLRQGFTIEMLPAKHGDALWRTRRIIIDGGPLHAFPAFETRVKKMPDGEQRIELLVITHVDTDHIESIIRLLALPRAKWPLEPADIWFNGYRHFRAQTDLGGREGEFLSALIHRRAFDDWNRAFGGAAVVVAADKPLPRVVLADGMVLTLLSPDEKTLDVMGRTWEKNVAEWEIDPGNLDEAWAQLVVETKFHPNDELTLGPDDLTAQLRAQLKGVDPSAANGSSIAFLAEYAGRSCLFLADAHMSVVCASIRRLLPPGQECLRVDAVKMAHHGSKNNFTPEFLQLVDAEHFLFSSNGDKFKHPDAQAVEAVIAGARRKPTLWFNYRTIFTERWESGSLSAAARYATRYPKVGDEGITLTL